MQLSRLLLSRRRATAVYCCTTVQGIWMKYETRRASLWSANGETSMWMECRRLSSINFVLLSLSLSVSSINIASGGRDTARFDTQYPECYGLRKRGRESRLSRRLIVRYFLCPQSGTLRTLPTRTFPAPKREHICIHRRSPPSFHFSLHGKGWIFHEWSRTWMMQRSWCEIMSKLEGYKLHCIAIKHPGMTALKQTWHQRN